MSTIPPPSRCRGRLPSGTLASTDEDSVLGAAAHVQHVAQEFRESAATVIPASIRLSRCAPSEVPLAMTSLTTRARATNLPQSSTKPQPEKPLMPGRTALRPPYVEIHNDHQGRKKAAIRQRRHGQERKPARSAVIRI